MKIFFQEQSTRDTLSKFQNRLLNLTENSEFEKTRNTTLRLIINAMATHPAGWDEHCQINIEWVGDQFIDRCQNPTLTSKEDIDDVCSMCFRFLLEFYLSTKNNLHMEFESARQFFTNNIHDFSHDAALQIDYALKDMPISILKQLSNSEAIDNLKNYIGFSETFKARKEEWDKELENKETQVKKLKEALDQYTTAFNFVGLYEGFDKLGEEKNQELTGLLLWIRILSVLIVLPIITELGVVIWNIKDITTIRDGLLISFIPSLSLVLISIYYFRVLLFNYKSVKYQITQIDLRKTLCRFIQSYVEYSGKIKTKDNDPLVKFEHIIFSEIAGDTGSLPSTYDGIEQLGKLLDTVKNR